VGVTHPEPIKRKSQVRMAFQPVVDISTGEVFAYEALVRGANGEGAAEILARVAPHQRHNFDMHCRVAAIRTAVALGINDGNAMLAINFMPDAIESPIEDGHRTVEIAEHFGLSPRRLMFEFSDHDNVDPHRLGEIIRVYRRCGFMTTFEDFSAVSVGLGLLGQFSPDYIKLDAGLIGGIAASWSRRLIVESLMDLAKALRIKVIAEGVETAGDMDRMRAYGIDYFQGYFLAEPELEALPTFDKRNPRPESNFKLTSTARAR